MGIPSNSRGFVWRTAIANQLQITLQEYQVYEQHARKTRSRAEDQNVQSAARLIEVDLPRTWSGLEFFKNTGPFYSQVQSVLEAYAVFRSDIGYVQGMSYLAGMLSLYMGTTTLCCSNSLEPFDTFVCLANLLNTHFFVSLFKMNVKQLLPHLRIYEVIFSRRLPQLYEHFTQLGISPEHYLVRL
jgi:hypothetical protein